jgi:hypothetical protein
MSETGSVSERASGDRKETVYPYDGLSRPSGRPGRAVLQVVLIQPIASGSWSVGCSPGASLLRSPAIPKKPGFFVCGPASVHFRFLIHAKYLPISRCVCRASSVLKCRPKSLSSGTKSWIARWQSRQTSMVKGSAQRAADLSVSAPGQPGRVFRRSAI